LCREAMANGSVRPCPRAERAGLTSGPAHTVPPGRTGMRIRKSESGRCRWPRLARQHGAIRRKDRELRRPWLSLGDTGRRAGSALRLSTLHRKLESVAHSAKGGQTCSTTAGGCMQALSAKDAKCGFGRHQSHLRWPLLPSYFRRSEKLLGNRG
jgi:hypothetical protein